MGPSTVASTSLLTIIEHPSNQYTPSIRANVTSADLTVAVAADFNTQALQYSRSAARDSYLEIPLEGDAVQAARVLFREVKARKARTLNITGNEGHSLAPLRCWSSDLLAEWIGVLIGKVHQHHHLDAIRTSGQSGIECAGAVAGLVLGLPVTMLMPRGYLRRTQRGSQCCTEPELRREIEEGVMKLRPILASYGIN